MIYSMTGFGKATAEYGNKKIIVTVRTLNSKQADIQVRMPVAFKEKELEIRNLLTSELQRGKIDFTLSVEEQNTSAVGAVNLQPEQIKEYVHQIRRISQEADIPEPINWFEVLLRLPGSTSPIQANEENADEICQEEWDIVKTAIIDSLKQLNEFRKQEGTMLQKVLSEKIENIGSLLREIDQPEGERVAQIKAKLEEALKQISEGFDRNRLEQEMIYYVEKLDVNEEKTRLRNHLDYFLSTMDTLPGQGKKLGFIAQEIGREINTLGSKSNHAEMQQLVVRMKDELEQIKEQVLNVL
ncbi:YicC/YloC family endoribonuclease [Porphyromonas macacae]|uniref:YicC/YloC family endoribonuclease n=1 Tax=Porphyromonas macacae TaxID=28115 RepID=UPI0024ACB6CF|nr:YicC/YloC family endoribonuclease [Porphyromonas macacae]